MRTRTKSIGTKLTEKEYQACEVLAAAKGQNIGAWLRQVLLEQAQATVSAHSEQTLLAELLGLRTILLNLLFALAKGQPLSAPQMKALIDRADAAKVQRARKLLAPAAAVDSPTSADWEVQP